MELRNLINSFVIEDAQSLEHAVQNCGLLPFFRCDVPGFSVEELTPIEYWFVSDTDGPWEWRMDLAAQGNVAYGKLFAGKAGFCSLDYYPDLVNYRRDGYDFCCAGCGEEGLSKFGPMLTRELRAASGVDKGFETCLTRLQMQTYITVAGFEYLHDKHGVPYGWGVARYALSESVFGEALTRSAYMRPPAESHSRLMDRLRELCPGSDSKALLKLIK